MDKSKLNDIERDLVKGLEGFVAHLKAPDKTGTGTSRQAGTHGQIRFVLGASPVLSEVLKTGKPVLEKYTCRRVVLDLKPRRFTPEQVKATRQLLSASQPLFAQFLGVSVKTVRAWKRGDKVPRDLAFRCMDEIQREPDHRWKRLM